MSNQGRPARGDSRPPPPSDAERTRALAQCSLQLERLVRLAREFDVEEIFDIACEFLANTVPLVSARLVLGSEASARVLTWETRESVSERAPTSTIVLPRGDWSGVEASLSLETVAFAYGRRQELAEGFMLQLSRALSRSRSMSAESARMRSGTRAALTALVVEDDDLAWSALARLLESDGYRVRRSSNGADALDAMRDDLPAVVLFDARAPEGHVEEFRRRQLDDPALRDVPLVIAGALAGRALDAAVTVIASPFDPEQLGRAVAVAILEGRGRPRVKARVIASQTLRRSQRRSTPVSTASPSARWEHFEHEGDLGVRGFAPTIAGAFEQAGLALCAAVVDPSGVEPRVHVPIACSASSPELLLVDFLEAIVFEVVTHHMVFARFEVRLEERGLAADAWGEAIDAARHHPVVEPKGATIAALRVAREGDEWIAECVVDV